MTRARRPLVLAACCSALGLAGLDIGVTNPALPHIGDSFHAGVAGLAWIADAYTLTMASTLILAYATGKLIPTWGPVPLMAAGGVLTTAGALLLARLDSSTSLAYAVASFAVLGAGYGLTNAPATSVATGIIRRERTGGATAIVSAARHFGAAAGVAAVTSLTATALHGRIAGPALAAAERAGFAIVAGCGLLIITGAVLIRLRPLVPVDDPVCPRMPGEEANAMV